MSVIIWYVQSDTAASELLLKHDEVTTILDSTNGTGEITIKRDGITKYEWPGNLNNDNHGLAGTFSRDGTNLQICCFIWEGQYSWTPL